MIVQVYEVSSSEEARALANLGVDHIGVLVGNGAFPREQPIDEARKIFAAIPASSKGSALSLSADIRLIREIVIDLRPPILHLGASTDLLTPFDVIELKKICSNLLIMRSIPVVDDESISIAKSYNGIADIVLLDSHMPGDKQIGALGTPHNWKLDRQIVKNVNIPAIIAGGLGAENVAEAISTIHPAGVDSKTKTDNEDGSHTKNLEKVKDFVEIAKNADKVASRTH